MKIPYKGEFYIKRKDNREIADNYIIKSVERISDGTKFKLGDKIKEEETGYNGYITEIKIVSDIMFFITDKYRLFENVIKLNKKIV